jgi:hypothetical protein
MTRVSLRERVEEKEIFEDKREEDKKCSSSRWWGGGVESEQSD